MFEDLGFTTLTAPQAAVFFGLGLGVLFGVLAQLTAFCLRRALVGEDRRQAGGVWLMALTVAVIGTQGAVATGLIGFESHRFMAADLPVAAIVLGGLMFGAGMVLTRGCVSRLAVLSGSGNLRAALVLVVFAVVAHATLKGVLSPLRTALGSVTVPLGETAGLSALPGGALPWAGLVVLAALLGVWRSGAAPLALVGAALIGALVPIGWVGTGFILYDDFDPIAMESLSFTAPGAEALFWTIANTAVSPTFGVGLLGGVIMGALAAALLRGQFRWQSFEGPAQTGRYMAGAALVLVVFAVVAHATLKGVLSPLRTALGSVTVPLGETAGLSALPGGALPWAGLVVLAALLGVWRSGAAPLALVGAALIGALVPIGWVGTGFILYDDFDPIAMESLSFTAPGAEALFWTIANTAVSPTFGVGLLGGVIVGALAAALLRGQFRWQSFEGPAQTGRYMAGAALMGLGGVLAGGCTVGAGLSGVPTLSFAALLALASMAAGGLGAHRLLAPAAGRDGRGLQPAG